MQRLWIAATLAAAATFWLSSPTLAGGWAVTTVDDMPSDLRAGQTYLIGFVMRQHGETPITGGSPRVLISQGDAQLSFDGIADGPAGHYAAAVTFPGAGEWSWSVDEAPFPQTQALGMLSVTPPEVAAPRDDRTAYGLECDNLVESTHQCGFLEHGALIDARWARSRRNAGLANGNFRSRPRYTRGAHRWRLRTRRGA